MANNFKKALAATLVAAAAFSSITPASQLLVPASISMAAADTKITVDSSLGATDRIASGTAITVNIPSVTTETYEGVRENLTYRVAVSSDVLKLKLDGKELAEKEATFVPGVNNQIQYVGMKGGKATLTITKYAGSKIVGVQTSEITVDVKSSLKLTSSGTLNSGAVNANDTVKIYKGEAFKIDAKTDTSSSQISGLTDFSSAIGNSNVVSLVTEDKSGVGIISPTDVKKESLKDDTYSVYFVANTVGTTSVTITQAAAKDGSTSANSVTFKVEVLSRDGELSVTYDADRDGNTKTYTADTYDNVRFTTKDAPDSVALDLVKNKTITLNAKSGNNQSITYSSSNDSIASVSNTGLITAVGTGSCDITVRTAASPTSGIKESEIRIHVNVTQNEVAYITLTGDVTASTLGTYDGFHVPDLTVGKEIKNDTEAYNSIQKGEKTLILSTKDKKSAKVNVSSNALNYLDVTPSDSGIIGYSNGQITAIRAGSATLTFQTRSGAPVDSTSTVILHVYVTDLNANNSIKASAVTVDPVKNAVALGASAAYGEVIYDTKVYSYDEKTKSYTENKTSGVTIDARGNIKYTSQGTSGTVYAKLSVPNSKDALGVKDTYSAIDYAATASNVITVSGASKDALSLTAGKSAVLTVSATDTKTAFAVTSSDESVAKAVYANGQITVTAVAAGTALININGTSGTAGYAKPEVKAIAVTVTAEGLKAATITPVKKTVTAASVKKANKKVLTVKVKGSTGTITATNKSSSKIKKFISAKVSGRSVVITLKKGAAKGTYKIKVVVAKKGSYKKTAKTVTVTVK